MSGNKRKRSEAAELVETDPLALPSNLTSQNVFKQDQLTTGEPVQLINGDPVQLMNGALPINQNNVVYIIVPQTSNATQNVTNNSPALLLLPKTQENTIFGEPPKLHYYSPISGIPNQINDVKADLANSGFIIQTPNEISISDTNSKSLQFECDFTDCILKFNSLYEKRLHTDSHMYYFSDKFKCSICNMVFEQAAERNKHVETHTVVDTYKCKNCGSSFPYYTTLVSHMTEDNCESSSPYSCRNCGVQFVDADDLAKHKTDNVQICVCNAKICNEQSLELHRSLCSVYKKKKKGANRELKRKKQL